MDSDRLKEVEVEGFEEIPDYGDGYPKNCFGPGDEIPTLSETIQPGTYLRALAAQIYCIEDLYIIPYEQHGILESYMDHLTKTYQELTGHQNCEVIPPKLLLTPGLYVAALVQDEWHRAKILKCKDSPDNDENKDMYYVDLVDFGHRLYVPYPCIRFLLLNPGRLFRIPAIQVEAKLSEMHKGMVSEKARREFFKLVEGKIHIYCQAYRVLAVEFFRSFVKKGNVVWSVSIDIISSDMEPKIIIREVEKEAIRLAERSYIECTRDENEEGKQEVTFPSQHVILDTPTEPEIPDIDWKTPLISEDGRPYFPKHNHLFY